MTPEKLNLTLYVASTDAASLALVEKLRSTLKEHYQGEWKLDVVDVIAAPEKASANSVFATPTLARDFPEPVVKVLGEIANEKKILAVLTKMHHDTSVVII